MVKIGCHIGYNQKFATFVIENRIKLKRAKMIRRLIKIAFALILGVVIVAAGGLIYLRHCEWNPEQAAEYATENAEEKSVGMCALYVRKAINAGGIPLWRCGSAWRYNKVLTILNFREVAVNEERKVGDIVVFQPIGGRKHGHIAIWNGRQWVSDFKQRNFIVHSDYTIEGAQWAIFRREN